MAKRRSGCIVSTVAEPNRYGNASQKKNGVFGAASKRTVMAKAMAIVLVACLCLGFLVGVSGCSKRPSENKLPSVDLPYPDPSDSVSYVNAYANATKVGYFAETLGNVERYKPVEGVHDGGLATGYPKYGYTLSLTTDQKNAILAENRSLCAKPTTNTGGVYDWMDEDGYLYTGTRENATPLSDGSGQRQLYKHSGSVGLYGGNVSDEEPAVVKKLTFRPRSYGSYYNVTGLYAPAGEVIKIQLSEADMRATGGLIIHIGQALYNGQANNIWNARNFNRMPVILNTMYVTTSTAVLENGVYTAYVGSFLGGPIYVRSESVEFSVTVSGGVNYPHFILGHTTEEEYAEYTKSSVPFFDLEVWDSGVLHSGPYAYAKRFSYEELYKAAILWEKISLVSTRVSNQGIVFMYDPFVAAGAAVAFPGRRSVNCPMGWMTNSLNYSGIVTSGAWGNLHEYHHNFQNYGVGDRGEVTNNALNLVAYSLFTKISSARQISSYGGAGLSGWNCYTSATWALQRVNTRQISSTNGLAVYATLLHNLGQDAFIKSTGASGANYFNRWAANTHQDFSYYASLISSYGGNLTLAENDYPMFVPVSCVYQTGRSYTYDGEKRYSETMQPFVIPYGKPYTVDLNPYIVNAASQYESGSVVIGNGFGYKIKRVNALGIDGTFEKTGEGIYTFTPGSALRSGKIYVTLEITTADGEHTYNGKQLEDVDLVLEFEQSHESDKAVLERAVYTYEGDTEYVSASSAYEANYAGYTSVEEENNGNYSQNSNTDVWLYPHKDIYINDPKYAPYVVNDKQIFELRGKLYFPEEGKYRVYMRGRVSCALYLSLDNGKSYEKAAAIDEDMSKIPANSHLFRLTDSNTYKDIDVRAEQWVYFKEVLVTKQIGTGNTCSYIGLGIGTWTVPLYTTQVKYYDANGDEVPEDSENIVRTETLYFNERGDQVTEEEASHVEPVPPTSATYATAYRESYEFTKEFTSEYFYTRNYRYNYEDASTPDVLTTRLPQTYMENVGTYVPWYEYQVVENLFDGDPAMAIHFNSSFGVSASKPAILAFDMGEVVKANQLTLDVYVDGSASNNNGNNAFPRVMVLQGSLDGENWYEMGRWSVLNASYSGVPLSFPAATFRYYKVTVTESNNFTAHRVAFSGLALSYVLRLDGSENNHFSPDNAMFAYTGNWRTAQADANFGKVYVGQKGAEMRFEFDGTEFVILSSKYYGKNFEVYIDGKLAESRKVKEDDGEYAVSYLSPALSPVRHSVIIRCTGEANIDSVAVY